MTPVFCCGFECGVAGSNGEHWSTVNPGASTFSTTTVRSGSRAARLNLSASANPAAFETTRGVSGTLLVGRAYVRFATLPSINFNVFSVLASSSGFRAGAIFNASDSKIYPGYDLTNIGSSGFTVTTGQWYLVDIRVNVASNPWLIDVSIDGNTLTQYAPANAADTLTTVAFGRSASAAGLTVDMFVDDVIFSATSGDYPIGPGKVEHFVPTADGTHNIAGANDFEIGTGGTDILNATTTAYQLVDDVPLQSGAPGTTDFINMVAPPNATDYVECIFGPAPGISTPTDPPRAVEVIAGIAQAGTGTGNMEIRLNDNGTMGTVYTATGVAGVTSIVYKRSHFADPPSAATVWNVNNDGSNGDFRDLRVRFGSPAALDVNPDQYFTGIMIEAEFEEAPAGTIASPGVGAVIATGLSPQIDLSIATGLGQVTATGLAPSLDNGINTGLGELTVTGFSPTVQTTNNTQADTFTGEATLTGFSPTVSATQNQTATPGLGEVLATGFSPLLDLSIATGLGEVIAQGFAPVLDLSVATGLGQLTITGYEPTIQTPVLVQTNTGEITATGYEPTITVSVTAQTQTGELVATGFEPTVTATNHITVQTNTGEATLNGFSPVVTASDHITIQTATGELILSGFAPDVSGGTSVFPGYGEVLLNGFSPSVQITNNITVETLTGEALVNGYAPLIQLPVSVQPGTGDATLTGFEPVITVAAMVVTGTGQLVVTGFAPDVEAGGSVNVSPGLGELILSGYRPKILTSKRVVRKSRVSNSRTAASEVGNGNIDSNISGNAVKDSTVTDVF